jgi:ATP-dependent Zn protease
VRQSRKQSAYHEAGHAVIGRILTQTCGSATIQADEDSAAHAITADPWRTIWDWELAGKFRDSESVFRGRIMTFMAGREAEEECLGRCQGGDGHDVEQIALMLAELYDEPRAERMEDRLRSKTRGLVRRHRGTIERVAKALLKRTMLSSEEIAALIPRSKAADAVEVVRAPLGAIFREAREKGGLEERSEPRDPAG